MTQAMTFAAIIVAAGAGTRIGSGPAKQWRMLAGKPVLQWSIEAFTAAGVAEGVVVIPADAGATAQPILAGRPGWRTVPGGATRALSVQAGLAALGVSADTPVLVHDAARPLLKPAHISDLLAALESADAALPALAVADTLRRVTDGATETVSRECLWRAQTPQAARRARLESAYARWSGPGEPTDDAAVVEADGGRIALTPGDAALMKLTYPEDFAMAELLAGKTMTMRIGQGFDAHRWGPGEAVWLCGVQIAHDQTLIGHSDADAGLHALTDALLGALGEGDIGDHFPPTDPQWKGAASDLFLKHAADMVTARGGRILNLDVTLICERPKIKPHRAAMRQRLADLLGLALDQVSVKATTTEGMGFTGRQEGLAAQAVALIEVPT